MLFSLYIIKDRKTKLNSIFNKLKEKQEDYSTEVNRIFGLCYDIKLALKEIKYINEYYEYENIDANINFYLKNISNNKNDYNTINTNLNEIITNIELVDVNHDMYCNSGTYDFDYINNLIFKNIIANIDNKNREFSIFDPKCKSGEKLKEIKDANELALLYGLEENNYYAEEAKEICTKIIKGKLKGSRISNDVFDMIISTPKISPKLENNMFCASIAKKEKIYIQNTLKYLRVNGIFFLTLPFYRMHKDICELLSKNLSNIQIIKGFGQDERKGLIYIIGQKKQKKEIELDSYNKLRMSYDYSKISTIYEINLPKYELPYNKLDIDLFKGSVLDQEELLNIVQHSGLLENFKKNQEVKDSKEKTQPLLPFNIGQIGLILTSGCLDGIIDEGDGFKHLVKGKVSKSSDIERTVENGEIHEVETINNKVEINLLLPDGTFKTLT